MGGIPLEGESLLLPILGYYYRDDEDYSFLQGWEWSGRRWSSDGNRRYASTSSLAAALAIRARVVAIMRLPIYYDRLFHFS